MRRRLKRRYGRARAKSTEIRVARYGGHGLEAGDRLEVKRVEPGTYHVLRVQRLGHGWEVLHGKYLPVDFTVTPAEARKRKYKGW